MTNIDRCDPLVTSCLNSEELFSTQLNSTQSIAEFSDAYSPSFNWYQFGLGYSSRTVDAFWERDTGVRSHWEKCDDAVSVALGVDFGPMYGFSMISCYAVWGMAMIPEVLKSIPDRVEMAQNARNESELGAAVSDGLFIAFDVAAAGAPLSGTTPLRLTPAETFPMPAFVPGSQGALVQAAAASGMAISIDTAAIVSVGSVPIFMSSVDGGEGSGQSGPTDNDLAQALDDATDELIEQADRSAYLKERPTLLRSLRATVEMAKGSKSLSELASNLIEQFKSRLKVDHAYGRYCALMKSLKRKPVPRNRFEFRRIDGPHGFSTAERFQAIEQNGLYPGTRVRCQTSRDSVPEIYEISSIGVDGTLSFKGASSGHNPIYVTRISE